MANFDISKHNYNLLSSQARVQVPFIKVEIGNYTFGIFSKETRQSKVDNNNFYVQYNIQYPNYVKSLVITKINGKVNQYELSIAYPVTQIDDPNFFEKVLSSVSSSRKIVFSYGDCSMPNYIYKNEEAIITNVQQSFSLETSTILYQISAVSSAGLGLSGCYNFIQTGLVKPSDEIKRIFREERYGLKSLFKGMNESNLDYLIEGGDKAVQISDKQNISILDYIGYLVNCMVPEGSTNDNISNKIYVLTIHDDTTLDKFSSGVQVINNQEITGPYFRVKSVTQAKAQSDAFVVDIGINTSTIVTQFNIDQRENYALFFDYQTKLNDRKYVRRINNAGQYEDVYAPVVTSNNAYNFTTPEDITWYSKITKYPINASITIQGLLRPAILMQYIRLNVIFPGGHKHISSGLYIVTKQRDVVQEGDGYKTQLSLARIGGDDLETM